MDDLFAIATSLNVTCIQVIGVWFLTSGSVGDGMSTFIGGMLFVSKMVYGGHFACAESESKKFGASGETIDMALLVDGLRTDKRASHHHMM